MNRVLTAAAVLIGLAGCATMDATDTALSDGPDAGEDTFGPGTVYNPSPYDIQFIPPPPPRHDDPIVVLPPLGTKMAASGELVPPICLPGDSAPCPTWPKACPPGWIRGNDGNCHPLPDDPFPPPPPGVVYDELPDDSGMDVSYWPFPWPGPWPGPSNGGCQVYTTVVCCTVGGHTDCWPRTDKAGG